MILKFELKLFKELQTTYLEIKDYDQCSSYYFYGVCSFDKVFVSVTNFFAGLASIVAHS